MKNKLVKTSDKTTGTKVSGKKGVLKENVLTNPAKNKIVKRTTGSTKTIQNTKTRKRRDEKKIEMRISRFSRSAHNVILELAPLMLFVFDIVFYILWKTHVG